MVAVLLFTGCGPDALEGIVTLDGEIVEKGVLGLVGKPGTHSPSFKASVTNGKFVIPGDREVPDGDFTANLMVPPPVSDRPPAEESVKVDRRSPDYNPMAELSKAIENAGPSGKSYSVDVKIDRSTDNLECKFTSD